MASPRSRPLPRPPCARPDPSTTPSICPAFGSGSPNCVRSAPRRSSGLRAGGASGDGFRVVAPRERCPDLRPRTPGRQPLAELSEETLESGGDDEQECPRTDGWSEAVAGAPGHEHERSLGGLELLGPEHEAEPAVKHPLVSRVRLTT